MPNNRAFRLKSSATASGTRVLSTMSIDPGAVSTPALSDVEFASSALEKLILNAKIGAVAEYEDMAFELLDGLK